MTRRYVLAPQAARDLVQIWRYVKREAGREAADRVESVIRTKCATIPAGHAFAIKRRAHGQDWSPAIKIGALSAAATPWLPLPLFPAMKIEAIAVRQAIAEGFQRRR